MRRKRTQRTQRTLAFGKYKGRPVNEIIDTDPAYCKWLHERFNTPVFTEKELSRLNHVWRRLHGTYAVLTVGEAMDTVYSGDAPGLAGRRMKDIRTTDLKLIRDAEPAYAAAARMVIGERRFCRTLREMHRRPAPVFQTDDI